MANIINIDHGQADWDEPLNSMLKELGNAVADTGWVDVPLENTKSDIQGGSYLKLRKVGESIAIRTQFAVETSGAVDIATIPTNLITWGWRYFVGYRIGGTGPVQLVMNAQHVLSVNVPADAVNQQINCDMMVMDGDWR